MERPGIQDPFATIVLTVPPPRRGGGPSAHLLDNEGAAPEGEAFKHELGDCLAVGKHGAVLHVRIEVAGIESCLTLLASILVLEGEASYIIRALTIMPHSD